MYAKCDNFPDMQIKNLTHSALLSQAASEWTEEHKQNKQYYNIFLNRDTLINIQKYSFYTVEGFIMLKGNQSQALNLHTV